MASKAPSVIFYKWIKAPLGFWLVGKGKRKLAHVWPGTGVAWWGCLLVTPEGRECRDDELFGPASEHEVKDHFFERFCPPKRQ